MSKAMRMLVVLAVLFAAGIGTAACDNVELPTTTVDGAEPPAETTEAPSETTEAPPETTEAPQETTAPEEEGEGEAQWWILVIVGLLFIVLLIVIANSGKKRRTVVEQQGPTWKELARRSYADSRWLFDNLTESLAIWRGNAQYDKATDVGATAETASAETWGQLPSRLDRARDSLYAFEAAAPDGRSADTARRVVEHLNATRAALDGRAEARYAYRAAEAEAEGQPDRAANLATARDRERRTSEILEESRRRLGEALTALSAIT